MEETHGVVCNNGQWVFKANSCRGYSSVLFQDSQGHTSSMAPVLFVAFNNDNFFFLPLTNLTLDFGQCTVPGYCQ